MSAIMRKLYACLLFLTVACCATAQTTIYARFTTYENLVLKSDGTTSSTPLITATSIDPTNPEFIKLTTFTQNVVQTLNIGSQSSGAGAGKITFNPFVFTRPVDGISGRLFSQCASGTPFRTIEIFFTDASNRIMSEQLYKLVAVKTSSWSSASCAADCPSVIENISMVYGGQIDLVYKAGDKYLSAPIINGWNAVQNVADFDPNSVIK
jgi:type VI protein secretion system component Hcp